jgi:hypothetical protein
MKSSRDLGVALNHLLKCHSKAAVEKCLNLVFISRFDSSDACLDYLQSFLELADSSEADEV